MRIGFAIVMNEIEALMSMLWNKVLNTNTFGFEKQCPFHKIGQNVRSFSLDVRQFSVNISENVRD